VYLKHGFGRQALETSNMGRRILQQSTTAKARPDSHTLCRDKTSSQNVSGAVLRFANTCFPISTYKLRTHVVTLELNETLIKRNSVSLECDCLPCGVTTGSLLCSVPPTGFQSSTNKRYVTGFEWKPALTGKPQWGNSMPLPVTSLSATFTFPCM